MTVGLVPQRKWDLVSPTELDRALCSPSWVVASGRYELRDKIVMFAGAAGAVSDHAVVVVDVLPVHGGTEGDA